MHIGCELQMVNLSDKLRIPESQWFFDKIKITQHNHFGLLTVIDNAITGLEEDAVEMQARFRGSCFGHFLRMHREMKFSGGIVHWLLLRELHHDGPTDEMRFMLGNQSVRFSREEFCLITGLKFGAIPDTDVYDAVENGIHQRYFEGRDMVRFCELQARIQQAHWHNPIDAVKLCLLLMVNCILIGLDERESVPIWQLRLVDNLDAFNAFPWGSHVYKTSIFWFKKTLHSKKNRYHIYGFAYALLVSLSNLRTTNNYLLNLFVPTNQNYIFIGYVVGFCF